MNKLILIPLTIMLMLTVINITYDPSAHYNSNTTEINTETNVTINGSNTHIETPGAGSQAFSLDSASLVLIILITALAVGIVAGINVFGSGLSDTSQRFIFNSVSFLGLWGVLTIVTGTLIFTAPLLVLLWIVLTIILVIGLAIHIGAGGSYA